MLDESTARSTDWILAGVEEPRQAGNSDRRQGICSETPSPETPCRGRYTGD